MRWFPIVVVATAIFAGEVASRPVSNEDIRDAILSVVNMIRATEDKLERHEYRERILGDQVKKSLLSLEKRIRALDQGVLSRLDERVATLESVWIQKDEKERLQLQKTFDAVEDIQKNLPNVVEKLKADVIAEIKNKPPPVDNGPKLEEVKEAISKKLEDFRVKINEVGESVGKVKAEIGEVKINRSKVDELHEESNRNLGKVKEHLEKNEGMLEKYESKLAEYNNRIEDYPQYDKKQNDYNVNIMQALDVQKSNAEQILSEVKTITMRINKIPDREEVESSQNETLRELVALKADVSQNLDLSVTESGKIDDLKTGIVENHSEVLKSYKDVSNMIVALTDNIATSYNQLKAEVHSLSKLEQVMVQTADGVMDTKRRVEYGVHQILLEVGDLVKGQSKAVNSTIAERFNNFEVSVLDEETGALANLTSKIGDEIAQVWRQIGIMHQQMSASTDTLNKLQNQTDVYVNGSLNVMDSMKGKVGKITDRINEVDSNLNYLMGRLSLVTQDFNLIKKGLGHALDEIRASFQEVQEKVKDKGPGPHKIDESSEDTQPQN